MVVPEHLDALSTPESEEQWSEAFLRLTGPDIRKCLATPGHVVIAQNRCPDTRSGSITTANLKLSICVTDQGHDRSCTWLQIEQRIRRLLPKMPCSGLLGSSIEPTADLSSICTGRLGANIEHKFLNATGFDSLHVTLGPDQVVKRLD